MTALVVLPAVALLLALVNALTWRRGDPSAPPQRVSVLLPARNEEAHIERAVLSVAAEGEHVAEIVVYNDGSTDRTGAILARLQQEIPHLRVIDGAPLPEGWVGKPHACHQLGERARGDVLLFMDSDVELLPGGVARMLSLLATADVVSAVPRQLTGSFFERLLMPLLHVTYTSWLPLGLVRASRDPRFLAANGQLLAFRRPAYELVGGFAAVRQEVVDDMAICRLAKRHYLTVDFADGHEMARCRMYGSAREVVEGFSKNLYEGLDDHPLRLMGVIGLYFATFVLPYLALLAAPWVEGLALPAAVAVALNLGIRAVGIWRHGSTLWSALLHPLGVLALIGIALNSWRWSRRGAIHWAGRVYASRSVRSGNA